MNKHIVVDRFVRYSWLDYLTLSTYIMSGSTACLSDCLWSISCHSLSMDRWAHWFVVSCSSRSKGTVELCRMFLHSNRQPNSNNPLNWSEVNHRRRRRRLRHRRQRQQQRQNGEQKAQLGWMTLGGWPGWLVWLVDRQGRQARHPGNSLAPEFQRSD